MQIQRKQFRRVYVLNSSCTSDVKKITLAYLNSRLIDIRNIFKIKKGKKLVGQWIGLRNLGSSAMCARQFYSSYHAFPN